jgi:hypothetical protein
MTVWLMLTPSLRKRKNFPFKPIITDWLNNYSLMIEVMDLENFFVMYVGLSN